MLILLLLMSTSFTGYAPMLPGSPKPASSPFSVALSLYLKLSSSSKHEKVMMTKLSITCAPIPRLPHPTHALLTQQALASGSQAPPAPAAPLIAPLPEGFALDPPAPHRRLRPPRRQKTPLLDLFLLPTLANPPPGMSTALLRPLEDPPGRPWGHTLIKDLPLQPVKAKALTQGRARATAPPTLMWLAKAKKAKNVKRAKGQKGKNPKGNKGHKGQKGDHAAPILEGGKGPAKGDSK